ncbi:hypothetical protein B0H63DRAFT_518456 [Podospora didyma]|uniref:C2H2-type domain-containing protein n=1 Tax=Podospora didyma TaxID=330526 RepID=A0AAE0NWT9_9PEZI|nr:hypothetical protein B0H63DRAFT_518456 [Podospora didyma]
MLATATVGMMDANQDFVDTFEWCDFDHEDPLDMFGDSQLEDQLHHDIINIQNLDFYEPHPQDPFFLSEQTTDICLSNIDPNLFTVDFALLQSSDFDLNIDLHLDTGTELMPENSSSSSSTESWTPFSRESSSLPTSSGGSDALCISPGVLSLLVSPSAMLTLPEIPMAQEVEIADTIEVSSFATEIPAPQPPQPQPPLETTPVRRANRQGKSPKLPARVERKIKKPVKCGRCGYGHAYNGDLKKHIRAKHPDYALELGLDLRRPQCQWCDRSFSRSDHLVRHLRRKHGLSPP